MSPFQFSILIHYHCCCDEYENLGRDIVLKEIDAFIRDGMLVGCESGERPFGASYKTTEKARYWIDYILATPYPDLMWRIPDRTAVPSAGSF